MDAVPVEGSGWVAACRRGWAAARSTHVVVVLGPGPSSSAANRKDVPPEPCTQLARRF
jgi:hypothetical protein